jgi:ParB-like chromosome segregation protein Spo0J
MRNLQLDMQVERWAIDDLIPRVSASIEQFGWTNPIPVGPDRVIIAGHGRLLAPRKLRMTEVQ